MPVWNMDDTEASRDLNQRKADWLTLIQERRYLLPEAGSGDVDTWLEANNLLSFLSGSNYMSNRRYYAYGTVLANTGKGMKRTFAIVTESALWLLIGKGKRLKFFSAPHSTLFASHIQDTPHGLRTLHEWTEATLLEYHRGSVRSTPITNLAVTLAPAYVKADGHANRRSESVLIAARHPQRHLYVPAIWSGIGKAGKRGVMEQGTFTISPDGTGKFLSKDFTNTIGDIRVFKDHITQDDDGTLYLKVDMASSVIFAKEYTTAILDVIENPYKDRRL